ncbi:MAG: polyprenyl synthetase family protein [Anaerolineales bacterium]
MEISDLKEQIEQTQARLRITIESTLAKSEVSTEYQTMMLMALPLFSSEKYSDKNERWLLLPELCHIACGGKESVADPIGAAWYLFYVAAFLMDHAEDSLEGIDQSAPISAGKLINLASGHFFLANSILADFLQAEPSSVARMDIFRAFQTQLLRMCDGQNHDLITQNYTLRNYYKIIQQKSGTFFSLACWSGARLAMQQSEILNAYADFGNHLGVLIQVLDDLEDWRELQNGNGKLETTKYQRILPALYTAEVIPSEKRRRFQQIIQELSTGKQDGLLEEYMDIIEKAGAGLYMLTIMMLEYDSARQAITDIHPTNQADEMLLSMIGSLLNY